MEALNLMGVLGTFLGLVGTASAVVLSWKNATRQASANNRQAKSQAIDDLDQVRKALLEEITRLSEKVTALERENGELRVEIRVLREENEALKQRVDELEANLGNSKWAGG